MRASSKEKNAFEIQKAALSPMNFQSSDMRSNAVSSDSYETQGLSPIFFSHCYSLKYQSRIKSNIMSEHF